MKKVRGKCCPEGHLMDPTWKRCPVCIAPIRGWWVHTKPGSPETVIQVYTIHLGRSKIGSGAECEIRVLNDSLARQHILLTVGKDECSISDLRSGKTVAVNNVEVMTHAVIDGDLIRLGDQEFKVKLL